MRVILTIFASLIFLAPKAQSHFRPFGQVGATPLQPYVPYSFVSTGDSNFGWHVRPFAGLSAGYWFLGGGVSYLSAPLGIVVYRPLNYNFTAFGSVTVAPSAFHFSSLYSAPAESPGGSFTGLGLTTAVSGGLIYTNDAKTFSISGGISVERGSYPVYVPAQAANPKRY